MHRKQLLTGVFKFKNEKLILPKHIKFIYFHFFGQIIDSHNFRAFYQYKS